MQGKDVQIQAAVIQAAASLAAASMSGRMPSVGKIDEQEELRLKEIYGKHFRWAYEQVYAVLSDIDDEIKLRQDN